MTSDRSPANLLLAHLSREALDHLYQDLEYIEMPHRQTITDKGELQDFAYFPDSGMVSIVATAQDGQIVEVGTIGREGFCGINIALGVETSDRKQMAQVAGAGWKMQREVFTDRLLKNDELRSVINRYALTLLNQTAQTALCNRLHTIEERCARWLLLTNDRGDGETVDLIQDFIAMMLGVRRAGVNTALRALQRGGTLQLSRGVIRISDRNGLESVSCHCYREANEFYLKTMGFCLRG